MHQLRKSMSATTALTVVLLTINFISMTASWTQDQVSWTPIYVDTTNHLDLWTISSSGCECPGGRSKECACCVKPGGCLCSLNPNKCAQCGLESACQRFCNVSISSGLVARRSGLSWVQIKSPELQGPSFCWWKLHSAPGQRVEVQIHRLVSVGVYNNDTLSCSGGFLQFSDGESAIASRQAIQLCAQNSRYSPPVVLFGDQGTATLSIRTDQSTVRSILLAYVSFSSADDPNVGFSRKGGRLRLHSSCDWIFDNCFDHECVLASPGFPGLFPPHRKCRYYLNANFTTDKIRVHFTTLNFPAPPLCSTHHVAIWRRNVSNLPNWGNPWKTLCQESEISLEIDGGAGVIEFRSGPTVSPYLYTGFRAIVQFIHTGSLVPPTEPSLSESPRWKDGHDKHQRRPSVVVPPSRRPFPVHRYRHYDGDEDEDYLSEEEEEIIDGHMGYPQIPYDSNGVYQVSCGHIFHGTVTRGNVFRLIIPKDLALGRQRGFSHSSLSKLNVRSPLRCHLEFKGKAADVVQLAIFNYRLRGSSCSAYMNVYDLEDEVTNHTERLLGKLCGPSGNEVKRFTSSHSRMALVTFLLPFDDVLGTEFLDGAFRFHDESIEGTVKPMSSCEVVYYGVTSSSTGSIIGPPDSPLLRLSTFPLVCAYSFLPGGNQSIALTLTRAGQETSFTALPGSKVYCRSFCGASGCQCESKYMELKDIDHLLIVAGSTPISCLCGYFPDALPMTFEAQGPITLIYHATQGGNEFTYAASFLFKRKILCFNFSIGPPSGPLPHDNLPNRPTAMNPIAGSGPHGSGTVWQFFMGQWAGHALLLCSKRWREALGPGVTSYLISSDFTQYTFYQCAWPVSNPRRYNLSLEFISEENEKDCNAWNLTVWAGNEESSGDDYRKVIGSFCPRYGRQEVKVPEDMLEAHIRLSGVTLKPPQFEIRWKYLDMLFPGLNDNIISHGSTASSQSYSSPRLLLFYFLTLLLIFVIDS